MTVENPGMINTVVWKCNVIDIQDLKNHALRELQVSSKTEKDTEIV
jgi:hypothetical protein